jgi:hypothetical protein
MSARVASPGLPRKRVKTARAVSLVGIDARTLRDMAQRGEIPGAAKFRSIWTFDLVLLEQFISERERVACENARRHQRVVSGGTVSSMAAFKPAAATSSGRYAQTIQSLRLLVAQRSGNAR